MSNEKLKRYHADQHAMQSGVAMQHKFDANDGTPKHLRVGINTALCDHAALVELLVRKKVITQDEYTDAIADKMAQERLRYEQLLSRALGKNVTLA